MTFSNGCAATDPALHKTFDDATATSVNSQSLLPLDGRVVLIKSKPIRTVLSWQLYATVALAAVGGIWAGIHGAVSAGLGGLVSMVAGLAFGVIVSTTGVTTAGNVLRIAMRAEAGKIILIVTQLWLVLTLYKSINATVFFAAFTVTVLINSMALVIRDE